MGIVESLKQAPTIDKVPVEISYRIIKLFSEGLYRSPYKAIEELIVNGYDAMASAVHVLFDNVDRRDGMIVVVDDGYSMDPTGLKLLWQIGVTSKRSEEFEKHLWEAKRRRPIGKFGIGKLASYVLANHLVYVTKKDGKFWAIDMDFGDIDVKGPDTAISSEAFQTLVLPLHELTGDEARTALSDAEALISQAGCTPIPLFGDHPPPSWTVAIMTDLKELAQGIQEGRLRYIVSTGLPIRPDFSVYIDSEEIEPYRAKGEQIWEAHIGKDDTVADALEFQTGIVREPTRESRVGLELPTLGWIWGEVQLFRDTLTSPEGRKRKAEKVGRSHGFFIMVRDRLVNEDPLFGLPPLSHRTFNRFRMVVHCDGLDPLLRSSRESVLESAVVEDELHEYLRKKFNEADREYEKWLAGEVEEGVRHLPPPLFREPIRTLAHQALFGEPPILLTNLPASIKSGEMSLDQWIRESIQRPALEEVFELRNLANIDHFAFFEADRRRIVVNTAHPFVARHLELFRDPEPLYNWALAEILLEAYLYEEGVSPVSIIRSIVQRRNRFFREIVKLGRKSAIVVARELREAAHDEKGLERALSGAFEVLGFDVVHMAQTGKPEGIAYAYPGRLPTKKYSFVYEAKSTIGDKVRPKIGRTATHREQQEAQYAIIVGKDYPKGNLWEEAQRDEVTLCRVESLARLLEASVKKPVGFSKFEEFLRTCKTPDEVEQWIEDFARNATERRAIERFSAILGAIDELQRDESFKGDVKVNGIYTQLRSRGEHGLFEGEDDLGEWLRTMERLAPEVLITESDRVFLETSPERATQHIQAQLIGDERPEAASD